MHLLNTWVVDANNEFVIQINLYKIILPLHRLQEVLHDLLVRQHATDDNLVMLLLHVFYIRFSVTCRAYRSINEIMASLILIIDELNTVLVNLVIFNFIVVNKCLHPQIFRFF